MHINQQISLIMSLYYIKKLRKQSSASYAGDIEYNYCVSMIEE